MRHLWQALGAIQILVSSSIHGVTKTTSNRNDQGGFMQAASCPNADIIGLLPGDNF